MIIIYVFGDDKFYSAVLIDEERGKVLGSGDTADMFRRMFQQCRDKGLDPSNSEVMEGISKRLYANWRNFYYWVGSRERDDDLITLVEEYSPGNGLSKRVC